MSNTSIFCNRLREHHSMELPTFIRYNVGATFPGFTSKVYNVQLIQEYQVVQNEMKKFILYGYNNNIGASQMSLAPDVASGEPFAPPSSQLTNTSVSSTNANDTSAGTGARTIEILGFDDAGNEVATTATMNE